MLAVHSRGLDRNEAALIKSAYWPEAEVDYGPSKGPAHQFAADLVGPALAAAYELTQHLLGQPLSPWTGIVPVPKPMSMPAPAARRREELVFAGRHLDQLELRQGHWKILHRLVVMDWSLRQPVQDERRGEAFGALAKGSANREDPSHALLPTC